MGTAPTSATAARNGTAYPWTGEPELSRRLIPIESAGKTKPPSSLPAWVVKLARQAPRGGDPSDPDVDVALAALSGLTPVELTARFGKPFSELLPALRSVFGAIRKGETPFRLEQECSPALAELFPAFSSTRRGPRPPGGSDTPSSSGTAASEPANTAIIPAPQFDGIQNYDPEDVGTSSDFLQMVKHRASRTLAPAAFQHLEQNVRMGKQDAINRAIDVMYGTGRGGPLVAMQFNNAGGPASGTRRHRFEEIINRAEEAEPEENRTESVIFNAELLGIQDEAEASDGEE